jgi:hypothetical protein
MADHKCLKVTIEFEDEILVADGEEAQKWHDAVLGMAGCCHAHGNDFPPIKWKHPDKIDKPQGANNG